MKAKRIQEGNESIRPFNEAENRKSLLSALDSKKFYELALDLATFGARPYIMTSLLPIGRVEASQVWQQVHKRAATPGAPPKSDGVKEADPAFQDQLKIFSHKVLLLQSSGYEQVEALIHAYKIMREQAIVPLLADFEDCVCHHLGELPVQPQDGAKLAPLRGKLFAHVVQIARNRVAAAKLIQLGARPNLLRALLPLTDFECKVLWREILGCKPSPGRRKVILPELTGTVRIHATAFARVAWYLKDENGFGQVDTLVEAYKKLRSRFPDTDLDIERCWLIYQAIFSPRNIEHQLVLVTCQHCSVFSLVSMKKGEGGCVLCGRQLAWRSHKLQPSREVLAKAA